MTKAEKNTNDTVKILCTLINIALQQTYEKGYNDGYKQRENIEELFNFKPQEREK